MIELSENTNSLLLPQVINIYDFATSVGFEAARERYWLSSSKAFF